VTVATFDVTTLWWDKKLVHYNYIILYYIINYIIIIISNQVSTLTAEN